MAYLMLDIKVGGACTRLTLTLKIRVVLVEVSSWSRAHATRWLVRAAKL